MRIISDTNVDEDQLRSATSFSERLDVLLEQLGVSKVTLAKRLQMTRQGLHKAIHKSESPRCAEDIGEMYGINPQWLLTGEGEILSFEDEQERVFKLTITDLNALNTNENEKNHSDTVCVSLPGSEEHYLAVRLDNPSMEPLLQESSLLIFKRAKAAANGSIVLFHVPSSNEVKVRQLHREGKDMFFHSLNDKYPSYDSGEILGLLIESRLHFSFKN